MSDELDDFEFMDELQRGATADIEETIPFEPDVELRDETAIDDKPDEPVPLADLEPSDVTDPLASLDIMEGFLDG